MSKCLNSKYEKVVKIYSDSDIVNLNLTIEHEINDQIHRGYALESANMSTVYDIKESLVITTAMLVFKYEW